MVGPSFETCHHVAVDAVPSRPPHEVTVPEVVGRGDTSPVDPRLGLPVPTGQVPLASALAPVRARLGALGRRLPSARPVTEARPPPHPVLPAETVRPSRGPSRRVVALVQDTGDQGARRVDGTRRVLHVGHHVAPRDPFLVGREGRVGTQDHRPSGVVGALTAAPAPALGRRRLDDAPTDARPRPVGTTVPGVLTIPLQTATTPMDMVAPVLLPAVPGRLAVVGNEAAIQVVPNAALEMAGAVGRRSGQGLVDPAKVGRPPTVVILGAATAAGLGRGPSPGVGPAPARVAAGVRAAKALPAT